MNSKVKSLSGAKPCVFSGNVVLGVAKVGRLFLRDLAKLSTKVRRTVARAQFALQNVNLKNLHS